MTALLLVTSLLPIFDVPPPPCLLPVAALPSLCFRDRDQAWKDW